MVSYLKFAISSMHSLKNYSTEGEGSKINAAITIILAVLVIGFPIFICLLLKLRFDRL